MGYVARRAIGPGRGFAVAGALGGILSSTSVTLTFSRVSQNQTAFGRPLAAGVMGANLTHFVRVLIATAVLEPQLALAVWPSLVAPGLISVGLLLTGWRDTDRHGPRTETDRNPLQIRSALYLAGVFQLVLFGIAFATARFGQSGLMGSAALIGTTDVDALILALARMTSAGTTPAAIAATALTLGILVNMLVKLGLALALGRGQYRRLSATGLALMAATLAVAVYWKSL